MTFFMAAMGAIMLMAGLVLISFLVGQATTPYLAAAEARYMVGRVGYLYVRRINTLAFGVDGADTMRVSHADSTVNLYGGDNLSSADSFDITLGYAAIHDFTDSDIDGATDTFIFHGENVSDLQVASNGRQLVIDTGELRANSTDVGDELIISRGNASTVVLNDITLSDLGVVPYDEF
jgi:hypothetical protein